MLQSKDRHSELLNEWKGVRNYDVFCNDGILDEIEWFKASPKILFLLKESNDCFVDIGGGGLESDGTSKVFWKTGEGKRGWGPTGTSKVFWRNINIWSYIISEVWDEKLPNMENIWSVKEREVNYIAYVNVKKRAECKAISDNNDIIRYAIDDKEFLIRQIDHIDPDIIYCCGTINSLKVLYNTKSISQGIYSFNNKLIIDYYHPSCRSSYKTTFSKLKEILTNHDCLYEILRIKQLMLIGGK